MQPAQIQQPVMSAGLMQQQVPAKMNEAEYAEILEKNRIISGSAISRAVQDASNGKFFKYS
jgi:hypothetical protein